MPLIHCLYEELNGKLVDVRDSKTQLDFAMICAWLDKRELWHTPLNDWPEQDIRDFCSCIGIAIMKGQGNGL